MSGDGCLTDPGVLALDRTVSAAPARVRPLAAEVRAAVADVIEEARLDDVEQVAAEVLANAVEHGSGPGGHVRVRVEVHAVEVVVRVTDAGQGVVPARSQVSGLEPAASDAERGRGLWLLYRLADRACFRRTATGRISEVAWRRRPTVRPQGEA